MRDSVGIRLTQVISAVGNSFDCRQSFKGPGTEHIRVLHFDFLTQLLQHIGALEDMGSPGVHSERTSRVDAKACKRLQRQGCPGVLELKPLP